MVETEVLPILERVGALIVDSHLVYTSGRHGSTYLNKDALYPHTVETSFICKQIAKGFVEQGIEVVAGPTIGGVILAQWVTHHLLALTGQPVLAVYAEEEGLEKERVFRRGYADLVKGKKVLIVEDVLTTGGSVRKVVTAVRQCEGTVVGVGALCNRGQVTAEQLDVPQLRSLVNLAMDSWEAKTCPLCQAGVPINLKVGKGAAFQALARKP